MAKTDNEKLADRLEEIQDLLQKKAAIEDRLKILTGVKQEEKKVAAPKPEGFLLMNAIREVLAEKGGSMSAGALNEAIKLKYTHDPKVHNVRATAKYMEKKGQVTMNTDKTFALK